MPKIYSAAIEFTDGNHRYEFGPWAVIVAWAARYGITLGLDENAVPTVTAHGDDIKRITLE